MSTKVKNPTTKSNLAKELKPFINEYSAEYKASYCLFSQYTKYELMGFYTTWNWCMTELDEPDKEIVKLLGAIIANLYNLICILDKTNQTFGNGLVISMENIVCANLKGAKLIDKMLVYFLDDVYKGEDDLKAITLTRQMFFNNYLIEKKREVPAYEI